MDSVLSNQRYVHDTSGIWFSKIENSSQIKKIISLSNLIILLTTFNLEKYVRMLILERHITIITSIVIKRCLTWYILVVIAIVKVILIMLAT